MDQFWVKIIKFLHLDELWNTFVILAEPIMNLLFSWAWFFYGYFKVLLDEEYQYGDAAIFGSGTLIVLVIVALVYRKAIYKMCSGHVKKN